MDTTFAPLFFRNYTVPRSCDDSFAKS